MKRMMMQGGLAAITLTTLLWGSGCACPGKIHGRLLPSDVALKREDVVALKPVAGDSTETAILVGVIRIIDGSKVQVLGIKFFNDQTARLPGWRGCFPCGHAGEGRAYYKALAAAPEADGIIERSVTWEQSGFPLLFWTKKTTFQGKAVKLKPD
jgi:hypothetical protein